MGGKGPQCPFRRMFSFWEIYPSGDLEGISKQGDKVLLSRVAI